MKDETTIPTEELPQLSTEIPQIPAEKRILLKDMFEVSMFEKKDTENALITKVIVNC